MITAGAMEGRSHFQKCNSNKTGKYLLLGVQGSSPKRINSRSLKSKKEGEAKAE